MRLLDARALIYEGVSRVVDDAEVGKPYYAILSHTWGKEEVLFEDIALGPNHEVDSLTDEQRAFHGYRLDSRHEDMLGPIWLREDEGASEHIVDDGEDDSEDDNQDENQDEAQDDRNFDSGICKDCKSFQESRLSMIHQ